MNYKSYFSNICSNSYIIEDNGEYAVVDPGYPGSDGCNAAVALGDRLKYILLTHRHVDHLLAAAEIRRKTGAKIAIHSLDAVGLSDKEASLFEPVASFYNDDQELCEADIMLNDGDKITLGKTQIKVLHTPGHSCGGVCFIADKTLFSGDTLFAGGIGRTDFADGSEKDMFESLRKLFNLAGDYTVCPGHGPLSTLDAERNTNPYMRTAAK